jgi:hypothetical protein
MFRLRSLISWKRYATALAVCLTLPAAAAHANGDPPSDVLLNQPVYYPAQQGSAGAAQRLATIVDRANKAGYQLKVALVLEQRDLGNIPQFFGKPQEYADHLSQGLEFTYRGDLLIVMPAGAGIAAKAKAGAKKRAIAEIRPSAPTPDAMAGAAEKAVRALAKADGKPLGGEGGGSVLPALLVLGALLVMGGAAGAWRMRARGGPAPAPHDPQAPGGEPEAQRDLGSI